jgi:hypothetical protein
MVEVVEGIQPAVEPAPRWRAFAAAAFFVAWGSVLTAIVATLMVGHWSSLPVPGPEPSIARAFAAHPHPGRWLAVHVLASDCRCSQRVFDHLFTSERLSGVSELVVLVGSDPAVERRAAAAGFALRVVTREQLWSEYHVESAPLLVVLDPEDAIRYAGGYARRKQDPRVLDLDILRALASGQRADQLPLYGCGVSERLQRALDPFGVKYR